MMFSFNLFDMVLGLCLLESSWIMFQSYATFQLL